MITIRMHGSSDDLPSGYLWKKLISMNDYPKWVKFCKSIEVKSVREGATYFDVTTLLWIPFRVEHRIEKIDPEKELVVYLPLSKRGKMWHKYKFSEAGRTQMLDLEVKFDLGNPVLNATVGRILEMRWETLMRKSLPELKEVFRVS